MTIAEMNGERYLILAGITQPVVGAFDVEPQQRDVDAIGHPVIEQRLDLCCGRAALRARKHVGVHLERSKAQQES